VILGLLLLLLGWSGAGLGCYEGSWLLVVCGGGCALSGLGIMIETGSER